MDHGILIDYLQEARIELLLSQPEPTASLLGQGVLVTNHQVEYAAPIPAAPDHLDIRLWIDQIGGAAFSVSYTISNAGLHVARARTQIAAYDLQAGQLRRLRPIEREQLGNELAPPETLKPLPGVRPAELQAAHRLPCRVRWSDLDSYGHVNNVRFFDYMSQGRHIMLAGDDLLRAEERWLVARQDLDYRVPMDFRRDPYLVRTAVTRVGTASCELAAEIVDGTDISESPTRYSTARTILVLTDPAGRPTPIGDDQRDHLTAFATAERTAHPEDS